MLRGWAMAGQGRKEEAIEQIKEGTITHRTTGVELARPYFLTMLAEACIEAGRLDEGLSALTEALATADVHEIRIGEPEMHRLKGELLLRQDDSNIGEAQNAFSERLRLRVSRAPNHWNCARR